jgi:hypothetical protein
LRHTNSVTSLIRVKEVKTIVESPWVSIFKKRSKVNQLPNLAGSIVLRVTRLLQKILTSKSFIEKYGSRKAVEPVLLMTSLSVKYSASRVLRRIVLHVRQSSHSPVQHWGSLKMLGAERLIERREAPTEVEPVTMWYRMQHK